MSEERQWSETGRLADQKTDQVRALIALYNQAYQEVSRYRDMGWKITGWAVAIMAGVITAAHGQGFAPRYPCVVKTLTVLFVLAVALYATWHIHFVQRESQWNRNLRRHCERIFHFYKKGAYDPDPQSAPLLPEHWGPKEVTYFHGMHCPVSWWVLIWIVASYTIYAVSNAE